MTRRVPLFITLTLSLTACGDDAPDDTLMEAAPESLLQEVGKDPDVCDGECDVFETTLDPSFVVTDPKILERFELRRVLDQLASFSGSSTGADEIWKQWWSSQRIRSGGDPAHHPFCDDNGSQINGFDITCPRQESLLEFEPIESHAPVALFNRFDLAPMDGAHCGEYRIVYALGADKRAQEIQTESEFDEVRNGRNFLIFEGVLPNPDPDCGLAACLPVAEFWQGLSTESDVGVQADLLEQFYFDGICDLKPVVTPEHYGFQCRDGGGYGGECGQIRTNQFIEREWNLREFTLEEGCGERGCELIVQQTTVAQNPHVSLWDSTHPDHGSFSSDLVNQMSLQMPVPDGVNHISAGTDGKFDAGESVATFGGFNFNLYDADSTFEATIAGALLGSPSTITEFDIEDRMTTQSCGGCHELSNSVSLGNSQGGTSVVWPNSGGFVHVDENSNLSPALLNEFLPFRQLVMTKFLDATCGVECFGEKADLDIIKVVEESDAKTGEELVFFELTTFADAEKAKAEREGLPPDTLSGARVH